MSPFDRLPEEYQKLCAEIAKNSPPRILAHRKVPLSPQNRRVRLTADFLQAGRNNPPGRVTRQQRRHPR